MMSYLSIFFVSLAIALSGALAPGPLLAAVIGQSARHGSKTGPLMILGHAILEMLMVAVIVLGLAQVIHQPWLMTAVSIAGSLILLFFGIKMLLSVPQLTLDISVPEATGEPKAQSSSISRPAGTKSSAGLVWQGFIMSIANPYWAIWWLTIGLGLALAAQKQGLLAVGVFFLGHILADLGWYSAVSLTVSRGRKSIPLTVYKAIIVVCAFTLIGFGLYFGLYR